MKRWIVVMVLCILMISGCGKKESPVTLTQDDPAYLLGKDLSMVLSILDPDSNQVLATSKYFDITAGEVLSNIQAYFGNKASGLKDMSSQQLQALLSQFTTQLINEKLLLKASKKAHIKATSAEVDSFLNIQYQKAGGEEALLSGLEKNEVPFEFFKESITNDLTINKYLNHVIEEKKEISEEQLQTAYQKSLKDTLVNVQHILLLTKDKSESEKRSIRKKMKKILSRARSGESFDDLARQFSEDSGSKDKGGLYENVARGQMVKPFENACFSVPVGEISDIVETQYGYHILKVLSRNPDNRPFDEVRDDLVKKIQGSSSQSIVNEHVKELREKANLKIVQF